MVPVDDTYDVLTVSRLLDPAAPVLSAWYADPLDPAAAGQLLARAEANQQSCLRAGEPCFRLQVLAIICHEWLGSEPEIRYEALAALTVDGYERALLELVQGQLLASRKLTGAVHHLENGFRLAVPYLDPRGYFGLLHRHESLGKLPSSGKSSAPQTLSALLNEAAVISRLRAGERCHPVAGPLDTVG